jgi:glycine C-acetyltransferase/8-amino-7-oxononanoate synthase
MFSTALSPPAAASALAALDLLRDRPHRVRKLATNATVLRDELAHEGFDVKGSRTQIVPLMIGDPERTLQICDAALSAGVFAQPVRPPLVTPSESRLRLTVMATHNEEELRAAARALGTAARAVGFDPRARIAPVAERLRSESDRAGADRQEAQRISASEPPRSGVFDFEADEPVRRAA